MGNSSSFTRLFTVHEANALLPTLRPLIESILENIRRLRGKIRWEGNLDVSRLGRFTDKA